MYQEGLEKVGQKYYRTIPVADHFDIVVAGGGLAGFGAACAAARAGARTILVERSGQLGGMASLAGVGNFCNRGPLRGQGSVFDCIIRHLKEMKAIGAENGWPVSINDKFGWQDHQFDHNILPIVLQGIADDYGFEVLYHTDVIDVLRDGADSGNSGKSGSIGNKGNDSSSINGVVIYNKSLIQAIKAKAVIDATGDGLVSQSAGARVLDINDPLYPDLLPPCFHINMLAANNECGEHEKHGKKVKFEAHMEYGKNNAINEISPVPNSLPAYKILKEPGGRICLKVKGIPGKFDYGCGKGFSDAEKAAKRLMPDVVEDLKQKGYANFIFNYAPGMIGIREGRRIEGDYILNVNDIRERKVFHDSVAYCEFTIDTGVLHEIIPGFQIPYRSLLVRNTHNLLVAGRCFSADRLAMSAARIMVTCCMMGQAAGYAAAEACRNDSDIRDISAGHIRGMLLEGSEDSELMRKKLEEGVFAVYDG